MKNKIIILLLVVLASLTFMTCCSDENNNEETTSQAVLSEAETEKEYSLDEMSPPTFDTEIKTEIKLNLNSYDIGSFDEIKAADSAIKNSEAEKILKKDNTELFFMDEQDKIFIILLDEEGNPEYSGVYKKDSGTLEYFGNKDTSWYFDEKGELYTVVYVFTFEEGYKGIRSYYTPDGTRNFVIASGQYYNGSLDELSDEEAVPYLQKYANTAELF